MKIISRPATDLDVKTLVALFDKAARWMRDNAIDQWTPGDKDADHFLRCIKEGEVWIAETSTGDAIGAYELWWEDQDAWGIQPPVAGYVHRLMIDRDAAPAGFGRLLLAHAEHRIAETGREFVRLDSLATNPRLCAYYEDAGYRITGEQPGKVAKDGSRYAVILLEKPLGRPVLRPVG